MEIIPTSLDFEKDKALNRLKIKGKQKTLFGKEINIKNKLRDFYKEISNYDIKNIICIDETNILSLQKRKYCYSEIGKRCIIKTHSQEVFKKYTGIFAISINGVIG